MSYASDIKNRIDGASTAKLVRAVIYARVSTDNDSQKESCANQVEMAKNYISVHGNIQLTDIFIDDGISGKSDYNRPEYNRMLSAVEAGKVELIIVKAMSRLNRDEYNSLGLINLLRENEATVLTLEDNCIHDFEDRRERIFNSIKFAMDADYVSDQSEKGRMTHQLRCERKELSAKDCSFGYDWHRDSKTITINEDQAEVVLRIFEDYVYRNGTPASIQRSLDIEGISLCSRSISNIIRDERYIGKFYINKKGSKLGAGKSKSKRFANPKEKWVLVERPDLRIIDDDLFEMAQRIHQTRITVYNSPGKDVIQARFQGTHNYAGKIFCPVCGKPYRFDYADRKKTVPIYRIGNHKGCPNQISRINEQDLEEITKKALKTTIDQQEEVCVSLERILTECVEASQNSGDEINKMKKQLASKEKQIDSLIDALSEGGLNEVAKERIKTKINKITEETDRLTTAIKDKEANKLDDSYVTEKLTSIKAAIADLRNFTSIDRDRILNYIERIELPPNGDIEILLKTGKVITIKTQNNNDFPSEDSVGKNGNQDVPYSLPEAYQMPLRHDIPRQ